MFGKIPILLCCMSVCLSPSYLQRLRSCRVRKKHLYFSFFSLLRSILEENTLLNMRFRDADDFREVMKSKCTHCVWTPSRHFRWGWEAQWTRHRRLHTWPVCRPTARRRRSRCGCRAWVALVWAASGGVFLAAAGLPGRHPKTTRASSNMEHHVQFFLNVEVRDASQTAKWGFFFLSKELNLVPLLSDEFIPP